MQGVGRERDLPGLLSALEARVRSLECRGVVSVGPWVVEVRASDGALVTRHAPTGTVKVLAAPVGQVPPPPPIKRVPTTPPRKRPGKRVGQTRRTSTD